MQLKANSATFAIRAIACLFAGLSGDKAYAAEPKYHIALAITGFVAIDCALSTSSAANKA